MKPFLWNVLLALAWTALTGDFSLANLLFGFGLVSAIFILVGHALGTSQYGLRVWRSVDLILFFLWRLLLANLRVAYEVLTPGHHMRPGILAVPLDARSDVEIGLLTTLLTLTPGSVALDISSDRRWLFVHFMYLDDAEQVRQEIKHGYERRILEVLR